MKGSRTKKSIGAKEIHVILDLDNTLVYSFDIFNPEPREKIPNFVSLGKVKSHMLTNSKGETEFLVTERPYLQPFLTWLFKYFMVSVWSAGSPDYVKFIVDKCIKKGGKGRKLVKVFNSITCDKSREKYSTVKDLRLLYDGPGKFRPTNTLIVDDLPEVIKSNPANSIRIVKYSARTSQSQDDGLPWVREELKTIRRNFRRTGDITSPIEITL